jgi:hypothetical protein
LAAGELGVDVVGTQGQTGGDPFKDGHKGLAVGLSGGREAQHEKGGYQLSAISYQEQGRPALRAGSWGYGVHSCLSGHQIQARPAHSRWPGRSKLLIADS